MIYIYIDYIYIYILSPWNLSAGTTNSTFLGIVQAIRKSQVILNAHLRCALASRKIVQKELRGNAATRQRWATVNKNGWLNRWLGRMNPYDLCMIYTPIMILLMILHEYILCVIYPYIIYSMDYTYDLLCISMDIVDDWYREMIVIHGWIHWGNYMEKH